MERWQDKHTKRAFKEGFRARSVYKLKELDKKYEILHENDRVIDLGCHPGSWLKYLAENSKMVLGIDIKDTDSLGLSNVKILKIDVKEFKELVYLDRLDVIVSDMAPNTTGNQELDVYNSFLLCMEALRIADSFLEKDGDLVMKYFQGEEEKELLEECRKRFEFVKAQKPKVSRSKSKEMFIVCKKFK